MSKRQDTPGPLGEGIRRLGREELIALALEVCEGAAGCGEGFHGNIHPGNITRDAEGRAKLGPRADHAPGDWSTDELEYMAPELFWNGTAEASADVYSIGLLLYAGVSAGCCRLQKGAGEHDERAAGAGAQAPDERGRDTYTGRGGRDARAGHGKMPALRRCGAV